MDLNGSTGIDQADNELVVPSFWRDNDGPSLSPVMKPLRSGCNPCERVDVDKSWYGGEKTSVPFSSVFS